MKKNWKNNRGYRWVGVIIFLFMLGMPERALTQEVGIEFSKGSWKKQLNQAKRQKKLIFLDCHTKWCGFCKVLAQYVFTDPEVARFYNQHFVNVEMDMEEGVGVELVKRYGIHAYPTLLFINAQGELEDYHAGYLAPKEPIALGERALKPENNLAGMRKRYAAGEREPEMLREYLRILSKAYQDSLMREIISTDLGGLDDNRFYTPEVWNIIEENGQAAISLLISRVIPNRDKFYGVVEKERVDQGIDKALSAKAISFIHNAGRKSFQPEECRQLKEFFLSQKALPYAGEYLATIYAGEYLHQKEYTQVLNVLEDIVKYHYFRLDSRDEVLNFTLRYVAECEDMEIRKQGMELLDALPRTTIREKKKPMYEATRKMLAGKE